MEPRVEDNGVPCREGGCEGAFGGNAGGTGGRMR